MLFKNFGSFVFKFGNLLNFLSFLKKPISLRSHLDCHQSHDSTLMAFQRLQRDLLNLLFRFAQKLLASGRQHLLVLPLNFHLKNVQSSNSTFFYCSPKSASFNSILDKKLRCSYLSNSSHGYRNAQLCVNTRTFNHQCERVQRNPLDLLDTRPNPYTSSRNICRL